MKLMSSKKTLKGKSFFAYALYACVGCLACASCEGMEKEEPSSVSSKQHGYFKDVTSDSNDSADSGEIEDYTAGSSNTGLPHSNLYQCSQSEIFVLEGWKDIMNGKKEMPKSNRRVPIGYLDEKELEKGALETYLKKKEEKKARITAQNKNCKK